MSALLETIARRSHHRRQTADERWRNLILAVADEKHDDPETVMAELDDLGRTAEELSSDVERFVQRRQARAALDRVGEIDGLREQIRVERGMADSVMNAAAAKHAATVAILTQREHDVRRIESDAHAGRAKLIATASATLRARLEDWRIRNDAIVAKREKALFTAQHTSPDAQSIIEEAKRYAAAADEELETLRAERETIIAAMMEP